MPPYLGTRKEEREIKTMNSNSKRNESLHRPESRNGDPNHDSTPSLPERKTSFRSTPSFFLDEYSKEYTDSPQRNDECDELSPDNQTIGFRKRHKLNLKSNQSFINRLRLTCGKTINNEYVQLGMIGLIILNAVFMGVATFDFISNSTERGEKFKKVDTAFLSVFTIELVMQFIYYGWRIVQDAWLVFDLVIISLSWGLEGLQIIRAFRIFRAFRLITRIKVLRDLVTAIGEVIPRMTAIGLLLILIFYIFAVLFTELFQDLVLSENYFNTLDASLFTCYEMMTLEWADLAREVMIQKSWAWAPFLAFIAITGFIVFNLIIAVICDAVSIVDRVAREREAAAKGEQIHSVDDKLEFAQVTIDELSNRVVAMLKHQREMQDMLELMATELYRLELDGTKNTKDRKKKKKKQVKETSKKSSRKSTTPMSSEEPSVAASRCTGRRSKQGECLTIGVTKGRNADNPES